MPAVSLQEFGWEERWTLLVIGHRECEAADAHISILQLLLASVEPAIEPFVALGREGTAVKIAILRGLGGDPPETGCLRCLVAMSISPVCINTQRPGS